MRDFATNHVPVFGVGTGRRQRENPNADTVPHVSKTLAHDRPAPDGPPSALGRQCGGGPTGQHLGAAHHTQLFTLGCRLAHLAATGLLGVAAQQWTVVTLAALCTAQLAGRGLLQRAAIPGLANIHPAQRDLGGRQWPRVDAGHRGAVFPGSGAPRTSLWRDALHTRRVGGDVAGRLGATHGRALGDG